MTALPTPEQMNDEFPETTWAKPDPVCPWCGKSMTCFYEVGLGDGDCIDQLCGWCEKPIHISCSISVSYTTEAR
jgi:hypothetical protein